MQRFVRPILLSSLGLLAASAADEPPLLRVTVRLVQLDAVVTDSRGRHVSDLKPEDFRLLQDGKPVRITHFSYVSGPPPAAPAPVVEPQLRRQLALAPPPTRESTHRSVALIVDDLGLSSISIHHVRRALRDFVDRNLQPGDVAAILRTGAGVGTLQQFTTDRRLLYAAIDRLHWSILNRSGLDALTPFSEDDPSQPKPNESRVFVETQRSFDRSRAQAYTLGSLGALEHVIEQLGEMPGRKSAILFSDGIQLFTAVEDFKKGDIVRDRLRRLTDRANRAAVTFYTIDARGLLYLGATAADNTRNGRTRKSLSERLDERKQEYLEKQEGMAYLARETGGLFWKDTNGLAEAARTSFEDQTGYYLLAYDPGPGTFSDDEARSRFHRLRLKVNRPGLQVRTRSGFLGVADRPRPPARTGTRQPLIEAIRSPFRASQLGLHLTALYAHNETTGAAVLALLHIDGDKLSFRPDGEGFQKAAVDLALVSFGEDGAAVDSTADTYEIRLPNAALDEARKAGFLYRITHRLRKPGACQLRAAVRDTANGQVGSASQFLEVPDWNSRRMALSGLYLTSKERGADSAALRRFGVKEPLICSYELYNPGPDTEVQAKLLRDGKVVWSGAPQKVDAQSSRAALTRDLSFGPQTPPGAYVLAVIARAQQGRKPAESAVQWTDFELVAQ
jgi:VWFA-related protein